MSELLSKIFSKSFIKQGIKYALVGGLGALVNLSILFLLTEVYKVFYILSEVIAFIIAIIHNYILDKTWTFKEKLDDRAMLKFSQFFVIGVFALILNLCILFILVEDFKIWYIFAEIVASLFGFLISFTGNKLWTFRIRNKKVKELK